MGRRIREKLHSQRGASLIMALVLFLICTVVGSIVLTAASTTNRTGDVADMDRQYYAVTSAAILLRQELQSSSAQAAIEFDKDHNTAEVSWNDAVCSAFSKALAKAVLEELQTSNKDDDLKSSVTVDWNAGSVSAVSTASITITADMGEGFTAADNGALAVTAAASVDSETSRRMTVTLKSGEEMGADTFTMQLYFAADILKEQVGTHTYRYTVNWTLSDVKR